MIVYFSKIVQTTNYSKNMIDTKNNLHWQTFKAITPTNQGAVGMSPFNWAERLGLNEVPDNLPQERLTRAQVKAICRDKSQDVLFGYICAMAWGGQGVGITRRHAVTSWNNRNNIKDKLISLRDHNLSTKDAFDLFSGNNAITGLGVSFFTKLLYFFSGNNFYIMDQWTAKSINLINGHPIVIINPNGYLKNNNQGKNYQKFCEIVDLMSMELRCSGEEIEERLFSRGGIRPLPWRSYVKENWVYSRYNPKSLVKNYD